MATVQDLCRYPIKGLSAEHLPRVALTPSQAMPGDRRFGLRHGASAYDLAHPTSQRKREFIMLAHTAELAKIHTVLDPDAGVMQIRVDGNTLFVGNVLSVPGRHGAEVVLNALIQDARGALQLVDAGVIALTDVEPPYLSIINLASLRDLEAKIGAVIDPLRFRGNIMIDGLAPWAEFDWVGKTITIGAVTLNVTKRIQRCVATAVNPVSAVRDIDIPALLRQHYDHMDCGVYAEVVRGGIVRPGDALTPP